MSDDPRFDGLPAAVVDTARQARCARCKVQVIEASSLAGTVLVSLYVPAIGARERLFMCGACGLELREFLHPELADDQEFQAAAAELRGMF